MAKDVNTKSVLHEGRKSLEEFSNTATAGKSPYDAAGLLYCT
jgi:hypothetical protein